MLSILRMEMMTRLELARWVVQGLTGPLLVPVEQMLHDLLVLLDPVSSRSLDCLL